MKLVIDTDVLAAALLGEEGTAALATAVLTGGHELLAPAHWKAELANVVWKAALSGRVAPGAIDEVLTLAAALPITSVDVAELWRGAVASAIEARHPAYDTLFIELAAREETMVVTFDRALRTRFPERALAPASLGVRGAT